MQTGPRLPAMAPRSAGPSTPAASARSSTPYTSTAPTASPGSPAASLGSPAASPGPAHQEASPMHNSCSSRAPADDEAASGAASATSSSTTASSRSPSPAPVVPARQIITRRQAGKIIGPRPCLNLNVDIAGAPSPIPKSVRGALKDPNWLAAMTDEYGALLANDTWDLVLPPANANVVTSKWVFRHKLKPDGSLDRYKARWVLRDFSQEHDIDFDETFSPVVKPATIRVILSVALSSGWQI
ncbi:hypothetical protein QYE76_058434 [Lolium multiflorum]|uniref:Reverse transcriptase Ty1/copia-type domain-containing protein n=1 Tax=Lolium multiflorum TaxID=4521 RepID=A0AAD8T731_LOLMU|nr:hypothetical protein QYE76_058434 [Lolium multiflorum]